MLIFRQLKMLSGRYYTTPPHRVDSRARRRPVLAGDEW